MARDTVVLETRDLGVRFGGVQAVAGVNFQLHKNELRCLIGPNGAGKTSFFRCLTGQYIPTQGHLWLEDELVAGAGHTLPIHEFARRGIGVKTQIPSLMNGLSVEENIWLALANKVSLSLAEIKHRTNESIERFGLQSLFRRATGALSHGQRQKVELAMVLAQKPWLILLDEPAGGLTHDEVVEMAEQVQELAKSATLVVVEHDMSFVRMIAQRITVFHQGKILAEGEPEEVLSDQRVRTVYLGKQLT